MDSKHTNYSILRLPEVIARTGRSRSSIYEDMESGMFPQSVRLSVRSIGWKSDEIEAWLDSRVRANAPKVREVVL